MSDRQREENGAQDQRSQGPWLALLARLSRSAWALPLLILLLALVPRLLGLDVFLTADEDDQIRFAAGFLTAVLDGDWARAVLLGYPGVPTLAFGGLALGLRYLLHVWGVVPLPEAGPDLVSTLSHVNEYPLVYIPPARAVMVVVASLAVLGMYFLMQRLVGKRIAALAALLIAFDPFFMANSRVLHVDAPLAYFMFLSFLAFWLYLYEGKIGWLALSGVCGALATLSKTPGAFLGPILVVTGFLYAVHPIALPAVGIGSDPAALPAGRRWRRFAVAVAVWGVVAVVAFYAMWPSMWADPVHAMGVIIRNALTATNTTHPSSGVFWGPTQSDQNPLYYLISLPFRLTPIVTLGLILGLIATWGLRRYRALLLSLWAYAILFIVPVSLVGRRGDRYILPVYLALSFLTAIALTWLDRRLAPADAEPDEVTVEDGATTGEQGQDEAGTGAEAEPRRGGDTLVPVIPPGKILTGGKWVAGNLWQQAKDHKRVVSAIILAAQFVFILLFHPYYFPYLNPLVGGPLTGPWLINIGWGEGLDRAADYLNEVPGTAQKTVAAWYSAQFAPFFEGNTIDLSDNEPALVADYSVFYINQVQRGLPSQELVDYFQQRVPMHVVRLGGIDYSAVYPGPVIGFEHPDELQYPVDVTLGGSAHLVGYEIERPSTQADVEMGVTLFWEVLAPIPGDYNVYIRLVDDMGTVWGRVDRLPLGGLWRTTQWQVGAIVRDEYRLNLRPGIPPDEYHLEVAMYSFETGETFGVARNIGTLEVTAPSKSPSSKTMEMKQPLRNTVAPGLELMGYDLGEEIIGPGQRLPVTLYWRTNRRIDTDYGVTFDAKSVAGNEGGSWEEVVGSDRYPTSQWRWGEVIVNTYQLQMPAYARSGFYVLNVHVFDAETGETVNREILGKLEFAERERDFETPEVQYPVGVQLGDAIQLIGYDLPEGGVPAGGEFPLTLYWRALDEMDTSYTVFVHVVGPDGVIRGQWDHEPGQGDLPTTGWVEGEVITDRYLVPMDEDAPPWRYTILVGMYDSWTEERLYEEGGYGLDYISLGAMDVIE